MDIKCCSALLVGAVVGAAATFVVCSWARRPNNFYCERPLHSCETPAEIKNAGVVKTPATEAYNVLEDDILREQFTRNIQFFGEQAQKRLSRSFVIVVGLGGVGSHAAHMLLRAGVGRLRLIDFDQVTLSSLNRHAVATRADVGTPKATCLAAHFRDIVPEAHVEALVVMYTQEAEEQLLGGCPDFVVDAIDNIDTKVSLLAGCKRRGVAVICVAGAGVKADPTRIRIADISESSVDPLARAVRHRLKREEGLLSGIPVVLSTEKPRCKLLPPDEFTNGEGPLTDYQVVPNFRIRTIPVLGTSPAMFGMAAAAHVICHLCGAPFLPEPVFNIQEGMYGAKLAELMEREEALYGSAQDVLVDKEEVAYLIRDLWRGCSARAAFSGILPKDKGLMRHVSLLALTRWDRASPAAVSNLVLLTYEEAEQHQACTLGDLRRHEPEFAAFVEQRLQLAGMHFGLLAD